jgi:hypothetical protein
MAAPDDGTGRLFVIEQSGIIRIIENSELKETPFLIFLQSSMALVAFIPKRDYLELLFIPNIKPMENFYVYYSAPSTVKGMDHKSVVAEYLCSTILVLQVLPGASCWKLRNRNQIITVVNYASDGMVTCISCG